MNQAQKCQQARMIGPIMGKAPRQGGNVVQLPARQISTECARLRLAAWHRDECADCIQMAMACFLVLGALLFASALLRDAGGQSEIAHYLQEGLGFLAAASLCAALLAVCLALVHLFKFRQA